MLNRTVLLVAVASSALVTAMGAPHAHAQSFTVGGFETSRGGELAIADGKKFNTLRSSISGAFPGSTFSGASVLTDEYLGGIQVLIISSAAYGLIAITPLTEAESSAVRTFVERGGCAILLTDNENFGGGASDPANESVLAAVGMHSSGTGGGWPENATVGNPSLSPVTNGPFGTVSTWSVGWAGAYTTVPAPGVVLGTIDQLALPGLVVFPRHSLAACAGAVVAISDSTAFHDNYLSVGSGDETIILNSFAYFGASSCSVGQCGDINGDGIVDGADLGALLAGWNTSNTAVDLDASGNVDGADLGVLLSNWGPCAD